MGLNLHVLHATNEQDVESVFSSLAKSNAGALLIGNDPFFYSRSEQLGALALRSRVPSIFQTREFAAAGGLASYGPSIVEAYRTAGTYSGRILKGESPATLPVQEPTKFDLIINRKTAKAFSITIPQTLLATADELIE